MTYKIGGRQICSVTMAFLEGLAFTSSEDEFPEYCYSGEFSLSAEDVETNWSSEAVNDAIELVSRFEELAENELEHWPHKDRLGHDLAYSLTRCGLSFTDRVSYKDVEKMAMAEKLKDIAQSLRGDLNIYKGDDGLVYLD